MKTPISEEPQSELERRARAAWQEGVEQLSGGVRSRLTQARFAALTRRPVALAPARRWWLPAGVLVAATLAVVAVRLPAPHPGGIVAPSVESGTGLDDMELLADADALEMNQEPDDEFYEWATSEAGGGAGTAVGT